MTAPQTSTEGLVPTAAKKRRGPSLRPVNVSKRRQDADHQAEVERAVARRDKELAAATHPAVRRLIEMSAPTDWAGNPIEPPQRNIGSTQGVVTFRTIKESDLVPAEMRHIFTVEELDAVVEEDAAVTVLGADSYRHIDRIENSRFKALLGFQTECQEKAQKEYEARKEEQAAKLRRRAKRARKARKLALCYKWAGRPVAVANQPAGRKLAVPLVEVDEAAKKKAFEEAKKWADIARSNKAEVRDIYQHGIYIPAGKYADDWYDAIHEFFAPNTLRSHLDSPSLARMAQIYPKAGDIYAGYDKTYVLPCDSKIHALIAPYVQLDRKHLRIIVKEFDVVVTSPGAFRGMLLTVLPPALMPNLIVGRTTRSGHFARMHCIWILDPRREIENEDGNKEIVDCCVWNDLPSELIDPDTGEVKKFGDDRCLPGPIQKYWMVDRALTKLLMPLGADPAFTNVWKPKNPLSPLWTTVINNDDCFFSLEDFFQIPGFDPKVTKEDLERQACAMREAAANAEKAAEAAWLKSMGVDDEDEAQAEEKSCSTSELTPSDLTWKTCKNVLWPKVGLMLAVVGAMRARGEDEGKPRVYEIMEEQSFLQAARGGVAVLAQWFDDRVRPDVVAELGVHPGVDRVISRQTLFAANYCLGKLWRPRRKKVNRGRDRDRIAATVVDEDGTERLLTVKERRQEAAVKSAAHERAVSLWNLRKEMAVQLWATGEIRKTEFIKTVGTVSRSTAYALYDEALSTFGVEAVQAGAHRYTAKPIPAPTNDLPALPQVSMARFDVLGEASAPAIPDQTIDLPSLTLADLRRSVCETIDVSSMPSALST